jgi:hypothetical protein
MRPRLLRAVAAVAVLVMAACSGGGGGGDDAAVEEEPVAQAPTTAPPATAAPTGDAETFEFISDKNPFTPLAGEGTGGATTGTGTGTGTGTPGTGTGTGGTGTGGTGTGGTGGVEPEVAQRIALVDVFTEGGVVKANVRVNTTVHKVGVGETFAGRYKVLSLSAADECGRFLFGDDAFRLCRGQQVTK